MNVFGMNWNFLIEPQGPVLYLTEEEPGALQGRSRSSENWKSPQMHQERLLYAPEFWSHPTVGAAAWRIMMLHVGLPMEVREFSWVRQVGIHHRCTVILAN